MKKALKAAFLGALIISAPSCAGAQNTTSGSNSVETYRYLSLFGDVFERVREQYVDEVSDKELIESAINGMLTSLDPHSSYLSADGYQDMQVQTKGEFGGLGIEVTMEDGLVKVVSPIDDTPAAKAGILAGDLISGIDGEPVMGLTLSDAVEKMRGKVGEKITITIIRGDEPPFEVTLKRDVIEIKSVRSEIKRDNVGYIRITAFNDKTQTGLDEALDEIDEKLGDNVKGYILDLRNNPGGLLNKAISVSDTFLDGGEIVSTRTRYEENNQRWNASKGDRANGKPIIVLINAGSASASEIVSGALKDHHRAILMGERSFGKGSVQTIIPLGDEGAMRLTTARYYTPSGHSIQGLGIEPDIDVPLASIERYDGYARRREADLRGSLENTDEGADAEKAKIAEEEKAKKEHDEPKAEATKDKDADKNDAKEEFVDYQLERALDLLSGYGLLSKLQGSTSADKTDKK